MIYLYEFMDLRIWPMSGLEIIPNIPVGNARIPIFLLVTQNVSQPCSMYAFHSVHDLHKLSLVTDVSILRQRYFVSRSLQTYRDCNCVCTGCSEHIWMFFNVLPFPRLIPWSMLRTFPPPVHSSCVYARRYTVKIACPWLVVLMLNPERKYWQAHQPHCALYTLLDTLVDMRTHRPTERETEFISAAQLFKM